MLWKTVETYKALSRRGACTHRHDRRSGPRHVRRFDELDRHIRSGALRALATATRFQALPDLPTGGDFLPGYEASAWYGIAAPKNTPSHIIDKLNTEMNAGLADAAVRY